MLEQEDAADHQPLASDLQPPTVHPLRAASSSPALEKSRAGSLVFRSFQSAKSSVFESSHSLRLLRLARENGCFNPLRAASSSPAQILGFYQVNNGKVSIRERSRLDSHLRALRVFLPPDRVSIRPILNLKLWVEVHEGIV